MSSISVAQASLHRGAILRWAGWLALVSGLVVPLLASFGSGGLAVLFGVLLLPALALVSVGIVALERFSPHLWPRSEISDDGRWLKLVELRGSRRFRQGKLATHSLVGGLVLPRHGHWPAMVELVSRSGSTIRIIDGRGDAEEQWDNRWLCAHGLDAARAPARASLGSAIPWSLWAGLIANLLGFASLPRLTAIATDVGQPGAIAFAVAWAVAVAAISLTAARPLAPRTVIVGSDGVAIQHAFSRSFVPHADIEQVEYLGRAGLRIQIGGGRAVRAGWLLGAARRDALVALIDAWYRRAEPLSPKLEALRRADRSASEWLDVLGTVFQTAGYRSDAPAPADVLAAVDNAAAPVELRIGALVVLVKAGLLESDVAERLRALGASCASERLAKALEELTAGVTDAGTVEAALAEGSAVQAGVRTAQRRLQSEPSAVRDAAPDGGAVVETHFDGFMLAIVGLPIFPLGISVVSAVTDGKTDLLVGMAALSMLWLPYFVAWIVSRIRSERRFVFYPDSVWLPAFYHRIRGRFLAYQDIDHLGGDSEHLHIVLRSGKTRTYEGNVVDFGQLEETFRHFGVDSRR